MKCKISDVFKALASTGSLVARLFWNQLNYVVTGGNPDPGNLRAVKLLC